MKKKIVKSLIVALGVCTMGFAISCGKGGESSSSESVVESVHAHDFSTVKYDTNGHWTICSCNEQTEYEEHCGGTATCLERAVCSVCSQEYGDKVEHDIKNGMCSTCGISNSQGLTFALSQDGEGYLVTGLGSCEDRFVVIPDRHEGKTVVGIAPSAFKDCFQLEGVYIPNSVKTIGDNAFENCVALLSVRLGEGLTTIGSSAFMRSNVQSVELPDSLENIGTFAFYACDGLKDVSVSDSNQNYKTVDGNLYTKDGEVLLQYAVGKSATEFTTPSGLKEIGEGAFGGSKNLTSVVVQNGVTKIGDSAFYGNASLTNVSFGADVVEIGDGAFCSCTALTTITLNSGLQIIGDGAFRYCSSLQSVSVPNSIVNVGESVFADCANLTFAVNNGVQYVGNSSNRYAVAVKAENLNVETCSLDSNVRAIAKKAFAGCSALTSVEIYDKLAGIGDFAFEGCSSLQRVAIPNSTVFVGESAFANCSSLAVATVGNGVEEIKNNTFLNCSVLTSIELSDTVTAIGDSAFKNCSSLESLTIGKGVASIGQDALFGCDSLASIVVNEENEHYLSDGRGLYTAGYKTLIKYACGSNVAKYTVNVETEIIEKDAFRNSVYLVRIFVKQKIKEVGATAFDGCVSLEYNVYDNALYLGCAANPYVVLVKATSSFITECKTNENVVLIMDEAFVGCASLQTIMLGGEVVSLGKDAFNLCNAIETVYYKGSDEDIKGVDVKAGNESLTNATTFYFSLTEPALENKNNHEFWHYVEGNITIWQHNYWRLISNETEHWYECDCSATNENQAHYGGTATCTTQSNCTYCGTAYGETLPHEYVTATYDDENHWMECSCGARDGVTAHETDVIDHNATSHWYECSCGVQHTVVEHLGGNATCTEQAVCEVCNTSYGELLAHEYTELKHNNNKHWYECGCGEKDLTTEANHFGGEATCTELAVCEVCNTSYGDYGHEFTELKHDADKHWYECSCGAIDGEENHFGGEATCTEQAVCEVCNTSYGDLLAHEYNELKHDADKHWYECSCGAIDGEENHFGGEATCTEKAICQVCQVGYGNYLPHVYDQIASDDNVHWYECSCGLVDESSRQAHYGGNATCTEYAKCTVCNHEHGDKLPHEYTELKHDSDNHWYECSCGEKDLTTEVAHFGGNATCTELAKCEVCNTSYGDLLDHEYTELKHDSDKHWYECYCGEKDLTTEVNHFGGEATCTELAECEVCGVHYGELLAHEYTEVKHNATSHWNECACGKKDDSSEEAHVHDELKYDGQYHWMECDCSHRENQEEHNFNEIGYDEHKHWYECNCGAKDESSEEEHGDEHFGTEKEECPHCPVE